MILPLQYRNLCANKICPPAYLHISEKTLMVFSDERNSGMILIKLNRKFCRFAILPN